jgi:hypothetical protein
MDYPRAFVFINGDEDMPPLASVRKWFGSKMASDVYIQGQSPQDDEIDKAIITMTEIHEFIEAPVFDRAQCIVVSTTQIGLGAKIALSEQMCGVTWMDSADHRTDLERLNDATCDACVFDELFIQLEDHYRVMTEYVRKKTGQSMLTEPDLNSVFKGRHYLAQTEVEAHLKVIAKNETRSGVLWRIDLEDDSTTTQAA